MALINCKEKPLNSGHFAYTWKMECPCGQIKSFFGKTINELIDPINEAGWQFKNDGNPLQTCPACALTSTPKPGYHPGSLADPRD